MESDSVNPLRQIARGFAWTLLLIIAGATLFGSSFAYFCQQQDQVRNQCGEIFRVVRAFRQQRIDYPYMVEDERQALEREQWTRIIEQSSRMSPPAAIHAVDSKLLQGPTEDVSDGDRHWAYRRLRQVEPPQIADSDWVRNPIDQFVLHELRRHELEPAPEAAVRSLARRLWFDLTGLPPSPTEIEVYLADRHTQKFESTVRDLLDRPAFGERWARMWLDVARYADSNGYEEDEIRSQAYTFRDFVIWAMNHDLPFDDFVRWQIAGDEIANSNPLAVAATGFLTAGPYNTFLPQPSERRDELDDIVSTIGTAMLGTTVGCARCHDHMYDPISTEEYYQLVAVFADTQRTLSYMASDGGADYQPIDSNLEEIKEIRRARVTEQKIAELEDFTDAEKDLLRQPIDPNNEQQVALLARCGRCRLVMDHEISSDIDPLPEHAARFQYLMDENDRLASQLPPPPPKGLTLSGSQISHTDVLPGGQPGRQTTRVGPGFLAALSPDGSSWQDDAWEEWAADVGAPTPRTALANWLTDLEDGAGPLLARVIVNRLWQQHFGQGLVATPDDFGYQGDAPVQAELLEWLAAELVRHDWSLKHLHWLMITSASYRQSTVSSPETTNLPDSLDAFLRHPQRLSAEMIRDALLFVGGNLNDAQYGPAVFVPIPLAAVYNKEEQENLVWPEQVPERPAIWRRSIYVMMKRTNPVPLMQLYDGHDGSMSCGKRNTTTVPTQALAMMNSRFVRKQAQRFAATIFDAGRTNQELVEAAFQRGLGRSPDRSESELGAEFLSITSSEGDRRSALTDLCQVILMSNEFIYVD